MFRVVGKASFYSQGKFVNYDLRVWIVGRFFLSSSLRNTLSYLASPPPTSFIRNLRLALIQQFCETVDDSGMTGKVRIFFIRWRNCVIAFAQKRNFCKLNVQLTPHKHRHANAVHCQETNFYLFSVLMIFNLSRNHLDDSLWMRWKRLKRLFHKRLN